MKYDLITVRSTRAVYKSPHTKDPRRHRCGIVSEEHRADQMHPPRGGSAGHRRHGEETGESRACRGTAPRRGGRSEGEQD